MATIEQRLNVLAKLAGRVESDAEVTATEAAVSAELLTISESIASLREKADSAQEAGESLQTLAKHEIELLMLLGKASVARPEKRREIRGDINSLLDTIRAKTPRLKELRAEMRKEEISASLLQEREIPVAEAPKDSSPRHWRKGEARRDIREPLAIEIPDARNTPALKIFEEFLANVESQPKNVEEMIRYMEKRLGKSEMEVDPRFKAEAKQFVRTLATIREKILGRGGNAGMDDAKIREHAQGALERLKKIEAQAADALSRIDDDRPLEALPKDNIFAELDKLNRMPYFLGALSSVAEEMNMAHDARRMRAIKVYRGNMVTRPLNQVMYYGGLGAFVALAFGSFAFAGTGIRNFIINASTYTPYLPEIKAFIGKKGYTLEDIDYGIQLMAKILGVGTSVVGTKWMLNYRAKVENNPERIKFWIGAIVCIFGALAGIIEKGANALDVVDQKKAADPALDALKKGATALPGQLNEAAKALGKGAETFVSTEAGNGGAGAATMTTAYTYLGRPSPQLQSEFDAFKREKDKKGEHAGRLEKSKKGIDEVNKMEKYKKFGFELGRRGVKQVVEDLVKKIDPTFALQALDTFSTRSEIAGSTTMAGHIVGDLDIFKLFGYHDDTLSMVQLKSDVSKEFKKLLFEKYQKELGADITLLLEYLDDVSEKTGVNLRESAKRDKGKIVGDVLKIESLLKLPALGITDKHFKDLDAAVGSGAITSAFTLLRTPEGRKKLGESIRKGSPWTNFDEESFKDVSLFVMLMGSIYFGFDVGPGVVIEQMNKAAERRFRTELGQKFNEAYAVESNICMTIAKYLNASLTAGSYVLEEKGLGSAFAVPIEILAVRVRRNLAEKALREIPEFGGKHRPRTTVVNFLENQLGFDNPYYEPDVQGQNAKIAWLRGIEERLLKNDPALISELTAEIAPQHQKLTGSLDELQKSIVGRLKDTIIRSRKDEARKDLLSLRRRQLELIVSEIPAQIAVLKAAQRRIRETTSEDDDKPLALGTTGRLRVTPEFIKRTFLLNQIGNDIWRYETALSQARDMGIQIDKEIDVESPLFSNIDLENTKREWSPSTDADQAAIDQLIDANAKRFAIAKADSNRIDMPAFEKYMNELNLGMIPLMHDFKARMPSLVRGQRDLVAVYDRDDETGRGVISVRLIDTPRLPDGSEGIPEAVASVPFEEKPIPDFSNDRASASDALKALSLWLAPGGDVMTTMRAHVQRRELTHILGDFERKLLLAAPDMRFPLESDMTYSDEGSARNRMEDFAALKSLRTWKEDADAYFSEIDYFGKSVDVKHIDASAATAIAALYSDARNPALGSQKDLQLVRTAITFALKNMPRGGKLLYDAKPDVPHLVYVHGGKERSFAITTGSNEVLSIFKTT